MNKRYWDRVASRYDEEIFDTLKGDRNESILNCIDQFSSKHSIVSDFGCGIGSYLPLLSARFGTVNAIDFSTKCLEIARARCSSLDNILYVTADLAKPGITTRKAQFAISISMLITSSYRQRMNILRNISRLLAGNGHLLLVVPSLESAMYANLRSLEWRQRASGSHESGVSARSLKAKGTSLANGVLNWAGVLTKHYLKEELIIVLEKTGFRVSTISKVEYSWDLEFFKSPKWMKAPYPWDWLVLCQKV
jgi:SAM-dependent methyltransferase